jgi:hypothetical protein
VIDAREADLAAFVLDGAARRLVVGTTAAREDVEGDDVVVVLVEDATCVGCADEHEATRKRITTPAPRRRPRTG